MLDSSACAHRFCIGDARRKDEGMPSIKLRAAELGEPVAADRSNTAPTAVVPGKGLHSVASSGACRIGRTSDRTRPGTHLRQSEGRAAFPFRDCAQELEAVDRLLADARGGAGGCLVLRGEPGTGKTALLEYAVGQAAGMHSVRVTGIESESRLGFAAAHQLLVPFLSHVDRLPPPQRDALRTVAGLVPAPTPERFLVGLAMLTLLAEAARDRPLLVTIDDAQWLDQTSAQLLGFVGHRAQTHPMAVLAAVGEPAPQDGRFAGVPCRYLTAPLRGRTAAPSLKSDALTAPGVLLRDGLSVRLIDGYPAAVSKLRAVVNALLAEPAASNGGGCDLFAEAGTAAGDPLDDGARYVLTSQ